MLIIYYFSHRRSNTLIGDWVFYFFFIVWRFLCIQLPGFAESKIFVFGYEMLAESMLDLILEQSAKRLRDQAVFNYSQTS